MCITSATAIRISKILPTELQQHAVLLAATWARNIICLFRAFLYTASNSNRRASIIALKRSTSYKYPIHCIKINRIDTPAFNSSWIWWSFNEPDISYGSSISLANFASCQYTESMSTQTSIFIAVFYFVLPNVTHGGDLVDLWAGMISLMSV